MFLWLAFAFTLLIQLYFYLYVFSEFARKGRRKLAAIPQRTVPDARAASGAMPGVSLVISAQNEAQNLRRNLGLLERQNYPDYEIILVDDGSSDGTFEILHEFQKDHSSPGRPIHVLRIEAADSTGKKQALSRGIELADKKVILVTDADCLPASTDWIANMVSPFSRNTGVELVLGYGAYRKVKGSFLNGLIRYETLLTAIQYFSYALLGNPYMGVGRNLAYTKKLFVEAGGFSGHRGLRSGDDDLFVNQAANEKNTGICIDPNGFTISEPKQSMNSWIRQKRRHISTASRYKSSQQVMLVLFYLSQLGFYLLAGALFIIGDKLFLLGALILIRFAAFYRVFVPSAIKLREKDLLAKAPLYEISTIFMQLYLFIYNSFSPPKHW